MKRFEGFEHEGKLVINPTVSECGAYTIFADEYGFSVTSTGEGLTAWVRAIPGGHIMLTDRTGITSMLGADGAPFLMSVYTEGASEPEVFEMPIGAPCPPYEPETDGAASGSPECVAPTRAVEITLSSFVRLEYTEVIQVPGTMTDAQLDRLVSERYRDVCGSEFSQDPEYWERGDCRHSPAESFSPVNALLQLADGRFVVHEIAAEDHAEDSPTPCM